MRAPSSPSRAFDIPRELVFEAWTGPRRMAQWWGPDTFTNPAGEMVATVTFEQQKGKTTLPVRMRLASPAIREAMLKMGMTEGWSQSLDRLADLVATTTAVPT